MNAKLGKIRILILSALGAWLSCRTASAEFLVESLEGNVTPKEIGAFIGSISGYKPDQSNFGNAMATHKSGTVIAGTSKLYDATRDVRVLDQAIRFADVFLAYRNDQPRGPHQVQWTGSVEPVWPLNTSPSAGGETGAVAGHIAYVASLILDSPKLWSATIPDKDPYGYGKTYKARALTYVPKLDEVLNGYLTKYCVDPATFRTKIRRLIRRRAVFRLGTSR